VTLRGESDEAADARLLDAKSNVYDLDLAAFASSCERPQTFWGFLLLGFEHILMGFDHLAFLFVLLIAGSSFREAAKIITSFTAAHSITLALATLDLVNLSPGIVEPLIAVSILYVGLENIFRQETKRRWLLTFAFGLIHGFGFASVLRELAIGADGGAIVPLLSFNLGVEAGQIAMAALALPLIWKLKQQPSFAIRYAPACSMLVALAGGYWLVERTLLK
jgi:hydrogenase/urease accessory protein HupE